MSSTSGVFTGTSTYSSDFTSVINRAVQIASLPITQLNNKKTDLTSENTALAGLSTSFSSLQTALSSLSTAAAGGNYAVSYSEGTVATATVTSGAYLGNYKIEVVDSGSQASAASSATVTDPKKSSISSATAFTLTANGLVYSNITPATKTLADLASAINTATQGAVQATIVNTGSTASPQYQLSIQNGKYGALPITLTGDGGANLMGTPTTATPVTYRINGQPASPADPLSSNSRTLAIAPNISLAVLKTGSTSVTVTQTTAALASSIGSFVSAYNSAAQAVTGQRGSNAGALAGQSLLNTLSQSLWNVANYEGTGSIKAISDLGLTFSPDGKLSFDANVLSAVAGQNFKAVTDFLGSTTTGGFIKTANDALNSLTNTKTGAISTLVTAVSSEITETGRRISENQERVDRLQESLTAQMVAADAVIAQLQQQASYFTNMFSAMQEASKQF